MVAALGITALLVARETFGDSALIVVGAAGIVAGFVTSLVVDIRTHL